MNKEKLFNQLHILITGKPEGISPTITEYENLSPKEGLRKALNYLEASKNHQRNSQSDWSYWMYGNDVAVGRLLTATFIHLTKGNVDFPNLPDVSQDVTMDKQAHLGEWATDLVDQPNHKHDWIDCHHEAGKPGSQSICKTIPEYRLWHFVCSICGRGKYTPADFIGIAKELL